MRILQVIHTFPPFSTAGSEIYARNLSKELKKNHSVSIFHRIEDPEREEYQLEEARSDGLRTYRINNTFKNCDRFERTYLNPDIGDKFDEVLEREDPDIVHYHHLTCLSTDLPQRSAGKGIPSVFTLHDYWLMCQRGQLLNTSLDVCKGPGLFRCLDCMDDQITLKHSIANRIQNVLPLKFGEWTDFIFEGLRELERANKIRKRTKHIKNQLKNISRFIAPSRFLKNTFIGWGLSENKIRHLDYGFDKSLFEKSKAFEREGGNRDLRFGYIGTLIPSKGVDVLIDAFRQLNYSDIQLLIYGGFSDYHEIEDYPQKLTDKAQGDDRIKFKGEYENTDIAEVLKEMDIVVVPSVWKENSPLTVHEAFLAGKPVIASEAGGLKELVDDGVNGFLFEMGNRDDLANTLKKAVEDPDLVREFSENIPAVKSIRENAGELVEIYEKIYKQ